jgi:hypothetical protein
MFGANYFFGLLGMSVGPVFSVLFGEAYLPYLSVIDNFTVYITIFNHEKNAVNKTNKEDEKWTTWDKFSLLRNYYVVTFVRATIVEAIIALLTGKFDEFELTHAVRNWKPTATEATASLVIIIAFYNFLFSNFGCMLMDICATTCRIFTSIKIFKSIGSNTISSQAEMSIQNGLNGAFTLVALTFINMVFRGEFRILSTWIGVRLPMAILPFLQLHYSQLGLSKLHAQVAFPIKKTVETFGVPYTENLEDGLLVFTSVAIYFFYGIAKPVTSAIVRLFIKDK